MWAAIFSAIAAIPQIFGYIEKFASWLSIQIEMVKKKQSEKEFKDATDKAKRDKDTSDLDQMFDPDKEDP